MKQTRIKKEDYLMILSMIAIAVNFSMNIFCMKPLSFGSGIIVMDGGLLISWISFAIINIIAETYGSLVARKVTWVSGIVSFVLLIVGVLITFIPTTDIYLDQATHFKYIFSNGIRTYIASTIAYVIGNFVNIFFMVESKTKDKKKNVTTFFIRSVIALLFAQAVDNFIFEALAFAPIGLSIYEMRYGDILTASICSTIVEVTIHAILIVPFTYRIVKKIGKN